MSTNNNEAKPKAVRRSSLKNRNLTPKFNLEALKPKQKRSSISWGQVNAFKFKEFSNPTLEETKTISQEEKDEKHKKFLETRRRSIQNEFVPSKMMKDKSKEVEEILSEELRKNMENNIKVGKDAKREAESNSSSKSNSDSEKDAIKENTSKESRRSSKSKSTRSSRRKSKSSSRRKSSSESKSPSRSSSKSKSSSESESEKKKKKKGKSLKFSKKKEKNEEKPNRKKVKIKISEDKDKDRKSRKDRDKDDKKKEHKKEKKSKSKEKKVGIKDDEKKEKKVEIKVEKKDEIKDDKKNEIKEQEKRSISENSNVERGIDRNVRLISYRQARELDLDKVAYIALTDGSILIVRKEFGSNNQDIVSKSFDIPRMENTMNNKTYLIERSNNDNEQNYNYIESEINPKYNNPNFNTVILQREQSLPNNYQKEAYSFNNQIYSNTSRPKQNIVLNRNNQILNNNKYSAASNTIWKTNKNPPLFKYFSPYKAPTSQYLNQNQTLRQNYVIQSNNLKEKRIIQIKRPPRPIAQNKYKVVETIPFVYSDNYNNQIIGNQVNDKYIESTFYPESMNYETIVSQNEQYLQRQPNYIYSPLKKIYRKTDAFNTFEQDLNE